jgi:hypothetical protein
MRIEERVDIERPVEIVWRFFEDPSNRPKWDRGVGRVELTSWSGEVGRLSIRSDTRTEAGCLTRSPRWRPIGSTRSLPVPAFSNGPSGIPAGPAATGDSCHLHSDVLASTSMRGSRARVHVDRSKGSAARPGQPKGRAGALLSWKNDGLPRDRCYCTPTTQEVIFGQPGIEQAKHLITQEHELGRVRQPRDRLGRGVFLCPRRFVRDRPHAGRRRIGTG